MVWVVSARTHGGYVGLPVEAQDEASALESGVAKIRERFGEWAISESLEILAIPMRGLDLGVAGGRQD